MTSHSETNISVSFVEQMGKLQEISPESATWVRKQMEMESRDRHAETKRVNIFTFIITLVGQIFALLIGLAGLSAGVYVAVHGNHPWVASIIVVSAFTSLAAAFLSQKKE